MDAELVSALYNLFDGGSTFLVMLAWITVEVRRLDNTQRLLVECMRDKRLHDDTAVKPE